MSRLNPAVVGALGLAALLASLTQSADAQHSPTVEAGTATRDVPGDADGDEASLARPIVRVADPEVAARLTERAASLYRASEFEAALEGYREAYLTVPAPELLFNLGQCHRQLLQHDEAEFYFRAYLQQRPAIPHREMVESLVREAREAPRAQAPIEMIPVDQPATAPASMPAPGRKDDGHLTRRQRRWIWGLASVALVAGASTVLATQLGDDDPEATPSLGMVDWQ